MKKAEYAAGVRVRLRQHECVTRKTRSGVTQGELLCNVRHRRGKAPGYHYFCYVRWDGCGIPEERSLVALELEPGDAEKSL